VIAAVVQRLREPNACRRSISGPIRALPNGDPVRVIEIGDHMRPLRTVQLHDRPGIGERKVFLIDAFHPAAGHHRQIAAIGRNKMAERVLDGPVGAVGGGVELFVGQRGARVDQAGRGPDVVSERIGERGTSHFGDDSSMRRNLTLGDIGNLLDLPLVAVLAMHRGDGSILLTPVWHEFADGGFNVWVSLEGPGKLRLIERDPRVSIVVCESSGDLRGVEVRSEAKVLNTGYRELVRRTAHRYMEDSAAADRFADSMPEDGPVLRIEPGSLRIWDYAD
jgi:Pyridoxamine 5'-phosphate oxidase